MSVALDLRYDDHCGQDGDSPGCRPQTMPRRLRAVGSAAGDRLPLATVTALHRLPERATAAPVRLTRRGVRVLAVAVALAACALVGVACLSAPHSAGGSRAVPATVTVRPGDTLWAIASRLSPQQDPRVEVAQLQRLNRLGGVSLVPGQVLRTR